jgi:ornithine cyclodeaminase
MAGRDILILRGDEVAAVLDGHEAELLEVTASAYRAHGAGQSSLPNSLFLRFPNDERNRIIALPAFLGGEFDAAGVKWVSSFPGNLERGINRASAAIILNSTQTGFPVAFIEGSLISARRTAASAALAARELRRGRATRTAGFIGCGPINFEVIRFLLAVWPRLERVLIFDLSAERAAQFRDKCRGLVGGAELEVVREVADIFRRSDVVSLATTAIKPHISDIGGTPPDATILHVSLRDLSPEVILSSDNVVDDVEHVSRAQTSIHLAEQAVGNRDFIRATLAEVLEGTAPAKSAEGRPTIFSPFGLGVLDLAFAKLVYDEAAKRKLGTLIESFHPSAYAEKQQHAGA